MSQVLPPPHVITGAGALPRSRLSAALGDLQVEVMNFLNEVAMRYPQAISFAPGRPPEEHFEVERSLQYIARYLRRDTANGAGLDSAALDRAALDSGYAALGQYGRTNGMLGELIARLLRNDEGIAVEAADVAITVGCQEAMCIVLLALCRNPGDVALVADPAYIGFSGAARVLGVETRPIASVQGGLDLAGLERTVEELAREGKTAKLICLSPDFANPTGHCMPLEQRQALLHLTRRLGVLVVEDHAYNYFQYDGERCPALKSAPDSEHVIFLGSFSKSVYPGVRLGFLATTMKVDTGDGRQVRLADEMSKIKSLLTVNTSPLCQAIIGGLLLDHDCSLKEYVALRRAAMMGNRDAMLESLARHFPADAPWCARVTWNRPAGGFFLSLSVPFAVTEEDLTVSARDYGVLWTPMSYFYHSTGECNEIRLSFSYASPASIEAGIAALARMIKSRLQQ